MFRVPFARHPEEAPEVQDNGQFLDSGAKHHKHHKVQHIGNPDKEFASTDRDSVPSWIRDEQVVDKAGGLGGSILNDKESTDLPQHFQLIAQAQVEWYQYDVYARVTMLYGVIQYLYAIAYYSIGTTLSELRGYWISWAITLLFMVAQALVLRMDILQKDGNRLLPYAEWLGHAAPFLAILGGTMEFRWYWSSATVIVGWVFVILCFFCHFMMACRMLDLAWPETRSIDMPEEPTKQWWPKEWALPQSFTKALWILAPPKKLETGQQDLLNEMASLQRTAGGVTCKRRRGNKKEGGKSLASPHELHQECTHIDQIFAWWFGDSVWAQIDHQGQTNLSEQYNQYLGAREEVDRLESGSGSGGEGPGGKGFADKDLGKIADRLNKVMGKLEEHQDKYKDTLKDTVGPETQMAQPFKKFGMARAHDLPWQITRVAVVATIVQWFYMMVVSGVECGLGPRALLKPPGEPPWIRDVKLRSWVPGTRLHLSTEKVPDDYQLFAASIARWHGEASDIPFPPPEVHGEEHGGGGEGGGEHGAAASTGHGAAAGASHRRLSDAYGKQPEAGLADLAKVLPSLGWLVDKLDRDSPSMSGVRASRTVSPSLAAPAAMPAFMAPSLHLNNVEWPTLFEPRHLLCGPKASVLLTSRGAGALVPHSRADDMVKATPFSLLGILQYGPLAGAAWTSGGLQLMTKSGTFLSCPGHSPMERGGWKCQQAAGLPPLPRDARVKAAAVEESKDTLGLTVALLFEDLPHTVSIFKKTYADASSRWEPVREIHVPPSIVEPMGLAIANDELLITSLLGEVHRQHILRGTLSVHRAPASPQPREFHATCSLAEDRFMHLALRQPSASSSWVPELLTTA